ncbi:hypothetical protein [Paenibacillus xylanexedens]|uniref:ABC-type antimicrobial peptide transport system permease subunit n=1 Tax=Paenibacillus xylanexedens TaxID=528191 RepID=A0ABS4RX52_PAEXY|nr:hypothetical protein [Paenibacillus xylanexedens]MBP2247473.1 ABC-type antimicrobial peptide transport system permease subunit [Paenibacillus xylanexedens]
MRYLFGTAWRMARRSLKTTALINIQFVFIFLFLMILIGMVREQQNDLTQLDHVVGKDTWLIQPTVSNEKKTPSWNEVQVKWLQEQFPGKVGLLNADYSEIDNGRMVYTSNPLLWNLISDNDDSTELHLNAGVTKEMVKVINPPGWQNANEVVFLKSMEPIETTQLSLYLFDVSDEEISAHSLSTRLSELGDGQSFRVARLIGTERQNVVIESIYTSIILVFVSLSSILILTSMMSFILVRFLSQSRNLMIYYLYGATRWDLAIMVLFSNLILIGPAFIVALLVLLVCYTIIPIAVTSSLISGLLLFIFILFVLTAPVVRTNSNSLKINEI